MAVYEVGRREVVSSVMDAIPLRRVPTGVRDLLNVSLEPIARQAKAFDVSLHWTVADTVPAELSIDPLKIGWALSVLAGNALRYVPHGRAGRPGGSITVRVARDPGASVAIFEVQ